MPILSIKIVIVSSTVRESSRFRGSMSHQGKISTKDNRDDVVVLMIELMEVKLVSVEYLYIIFFSSPTCFGNGSPANPPPLPRFRPQGTSTCNASNLKVTFHLYWLVMHHYEFVVAVSGTSIKLVNPEPQTREEMLKCESVLVFDIKYNT